MGTFLNYDEPIYFTYARGIVNNPIVGDLLSLFEKEGIKYSIDTADIRYGDTITSFEQEIGKKGKYIIMVINKKYFRSMHCMYEFATIKQAINEQKKKLIKSETKKIFVIKSDNIDIKDPKEIDELIDYWLDKEREYQKIKTKKTRETNAIEDAMAKNKFYKEDIKDLYNFISNTKYTTATALKNDNYAQFIKEIKAIFEKKNTRKSKRTKWYVSLMIALIALFSVIKVANSIVKKIEEPKSDSSDFYQDGKDTDSSVINLSGKDSTDSSIDQESAESFLNKNKTQDGVIATRSGLQYKIISPGDGKHFPSDEDSIECFYRGTLLNGQVFAGTDLSGNQPARFKVDGVIKGWTEMLKLMSIGEKVQLWIPPNLGYGEMENGIIEPNSLLFFELELVKIIKPEQTSNDTTIEDDFPHNDLVDYYREKLIGKWKYKTQNVYMELFEDETAKGQGILHYSLSNGFRGSVDYSTIKYWFIGNDNNGEIGFTTADSEDEFWSFHRLLYVNDKELILGCANPDDQETWIRCK